MLIIFSTIISTIPVKVQNLVEDKLKYVLQIWRDHGAYHIKSDSNYNDFAFREEGQTYPYTEYYCTCRAYVAVADVNGTSYYFYSATTYTIKDASGVLNLKTYVVPKQSYVEEPKEWRNI